MAAIFSSSSYSLFITYCNSSSKRKSTHSQTHFVVDLSDSFELVKLKRISIARSHGCVFTAPLDGAQGKKLKNKTVTYISRSISFFFNCSMTDCVCFLWRREQYAIEHWLFSLLTSESWVFGGCFSLMCAGRRRRRRNKSVVPLPLPRRNRNRRLFIFTLGKSLKKGQT